MEAIQDSTGPRATLCTVLTPAHLELGALNRQLTQALNPANQVRWSIAYNPGLHTPGVRSDAGAFERSPRGLAEAFPDAAIRTGPTLEAVFDRAFNDPVHADTPPDERARLLRKYLGSYHHAAGLAEALAGVDTPYAVIIDPDLYVLRKGWIDEVLDHMAETGLAVFGTPWNPRWYQKYRGFPCPHLMVIDLAKVALPGAALEPDLIGGGRRFASDLWTRYAAAPRQAVGALIGNPWRALAEDLRQRRSIGSARDTGYRLMQTLRTRPDLKAGLVQAVFSPEDGFMPPAVSGLQRHPLVEAFLPDRLRYLPRSRAAWTGRGFAELGYPSFRERGWEEFVWIGAPFAVHLRGELQRKSGRSRPGPEIRAALSAMLARLGEPPLTVGPGLPHMAAAP